MSMNKIWMIVGIVCGFVSMLKGETLHLHGTIQVDDQSDSKAVDYALKALSQDFQRKLGMPQTGVEPLGLSFRIDSNWNEFDQHRIEVGKDGIDFIGSDEIGLIHGIYAFSEDILGIDPCIYFTGIVPALEKKMELEIGTIKSSPYTFTHRAMFVNDEDLIIGFQMEKQSYGMNMEFMEKLFETMLRLRMTGVIPSTLVLADEPHLKLASDMGLYIAQHHAEPLGSVPLYWPKNIPYSWSTHKEHFIDFWSDAIKRQKGKNVIWTLNFRGLLDRAFWDDDPSMSHKSSREEKAKIVNEVIQEQYRLLQEITGDEKPLVCGYLWGELSGLYESGLLEYPEGTMLLFADNGAGEINESRWNLAEKCSLKKGIYQHVSYHNRRTHMRINSIHPDMFQEQMAKAVEVGATDMIVLNVGNFKEKIFGIRQVVNYMTQFDEYAKHKNGDWFFDWYASHQLGTTEASVANSYRSFFQSQFVLHDRVKKPGDEYFFFYVERLLNMAYVGEKAPRLIADILGNEAKRKLANSTPVEELTKDVLSVMLPLLEDSESMWDVSLERTYDNRRFLSGNASDFYMADLAYPTLKMKHLTGMAKDFSESVQLYQEKDYYGAQLAAHQALLHVREALEAERLIERSAWARFEGWYDHDETARTWHIEELLEHFIDHLKDLKYFNYEYHSRNPKTPGLDYKYQPEFDSEYGKELNWMTNGE